jgi:hypothetical protein
MIVQLVGERLAAVRGGPSGEVGALGNDPGRIDHCVGGVVVALDVVAEGVVDEPIVLRPRARLDRPAALRVPPCPGAETESAAMRSVNRFGCRTNSPPVPASAPNWALAGLWKP